MNFEGCSYRRYAWKTSGGHVSHGHNSVSRDFTGRLHERMAHRAAGKGSNEASNEAK